MKRERRLGEQLVIRVEPGVRSQLEALAAEGDRTLTQEIRRAIRLHIAREAET